MADAINSLLPSSDGHSPSIPATPVGRTRRMAGLCLLLIACGGLVFIFWTRRDKPNGWLESLFAPQFDEIVVKKREFPKPHEVNQFTNAIIPKEEIVFAYASIDDVRSLVDPEFLPARNGTHVYPKDRVIGVVMGNTAKAYPLNIVAYHELVNDHIGDMPVLVTYCGLTDSAIAFKRTVDGTPLEFGGSGLVFNNNMLFYSRTDHKVKSLWSQMQCQAVTGPHSGARLETIPLEMTTWADWTKRYPETLVLSKFTDYEDAYGYRSNPVESYLRSDTIRYPVAGKDERLPKKAKVFAVWTDNSARAYPLSAFESLEAPNDLKQSLDGTEFTLHYEPASKSLRVTEGRERVRHMYALWFAWQAFYPKAELFSPPANTSVSLKTN